MREKLDALKIQNDRVERAIDHMTDILLLIRTEHQPERRELLWEIYGRARLRMNTESARLNEMIEQIRVEQKERSIMRTRLVSVTVILIVALLLVSGFAVAVAQEDVLSTNTPQVESTPPPAPLPVNGEGEIPAATEAPAPVEQPPVVVVEQPGSRVLEFLERVAPWLSVIAITLLIIFAILGRELIVGLGKSSPVPLRDALISGIESGIGSVEKYTQTTELTLDDVGIAEFRKLFVSIVEEIRAEEKAKARSGQLKAEVAAEFDKLKASEIPTVPNPEPWTPVSPADETPGLG